MTSLDRPGFEIRTTVDGKQRFAVLPDAPEVLCPINEAWYHELVGGGMSEGNALALAVQAPYRVTRGFGVHDDFATLEAALAFCNDLTPAWECYRGRMSCPSVKYVVEQFGALRYDICGPEVLRRDEDGEFETIHRPTHGEFYAEPVANRVEALNA